jgi:hypothetical protein
MTDTKINVTITPEGELKIDSHSYSGKCDAVMYNIRKAFADKMNMGAVSDSSHDFIKDEKVVANANQM